VMPPPHYRAGYMGLFAGMSSNSKSMLRKRER
jgi:hypothetical protein